MSLSIFSRAAVLLAQGALLLVAILIPDAQGQAVPDKTLYLLLLVMTSLYYLVINYLHFRSRISEERLQAAGDLLLVVAGLLVTWELVCSKFSLFDPNLFPGPAKVIWALQEDTKLLAASIWSSLQILFLGYGLAVLLAIPLGLWVGWKQRVFRAVYPMAKVVSPIPPTVYVPYAITLLPSFFVSSIFVIFIGAFWPIFINTLNGVFNIDYRLIESAKSLGVRDRQLMRKVLLPGATPGIFSGAMVGLVLSFIMLTIAEMIGATSGLGWYIQYFADFYKFDHVLAGMLVIGLVVSVVVILFDKLQKYCLRWQRKTDLA